MVQPIVKVDKLLFITFWHFTSLINLKGGFYDYTIIK